MRRKEKREHKQNRPMVHWLLAHASSGEGSCCSQDDLLKVLIVSKATFRALKQYFFTFSYSCLFVPWSGLKS